MKQLTNKKDERAAQRSALMLMRTAKLLDAGYERRLEQVQRAKSLKEDGLGPTAIGREMGLSESTVRSLLNPKSEDRMNQAMETVDFLQEARKQGEPI